MSLRMIAVTVLVSSGITSTCVRHSTIARSPIALARLTPTSWPVGSVRGVRTLRQASPMTSARRTRPPLSAFSPSLLATKRAWRSDAPPELRLAVLVLAGERDDAIKAREL